MKKEISVNEVKEKAEKLYRNGFSCSESVVNAIYECFDLDVSHDIVAMASGFSAGMGKSGCACGALSGGIMILGLLFGRTNVNSDASKSHELANELHDHFKNATGKKVVCCRILTRGFDLSKGEQKEQCTGFVGLIAHKVAEQVIREYKLKNLD